MRYACAVPSGGQRIGGSREEKQREERRFTDGPAGDRLPAVMRRLRVSGRISSAATSQGTDSNRRL